MKWSKLWTQVLLLLVALVLVGPALQADTTVVEVQLGDSFTASIATAGDTVEAQFLAMQGTKVRITVQSHQGASLQPTVAVRDAVGAPVSGMSQTIGWLPVGNLLYYFTAPVTGMYVAEIGGSSGDGQFWAKITGDVPNSLLTSVSGAVHNSLTDEVLPDVSVLVENSLVAVTDEDGNYSFSLAPGTYSVTFAAEDFESQTAALNLTSVAFVMDISLLPSVPVVIDPNVSGDMVSGGSLTATVDVLLPLGSTVDSILWTQEYGVPVDIVNAGTDTATITLGTESAYKDELLHLLSEPPIGPEQLPPNVPPPDGEFPGGLQDRYQVVGINPLAIEEAALVVLNVEVETEFGTFSEQVEIHTQLPWKANPGLRNVAVGISALLYAKEQVSYDWTLIPPPGSVAILQDETTRSPYFTPDIPGLYELEVSDALGAEPLTIEVFAGTWRGVIVDQDIDGRPVPDTACTFCHDGVSAPDKFTEWAQSGHAEIFTNNLDTSTHYGSSCFACHLVGFEPTAENNGADDASDFQDFMDAGLINTPGDNWSAVLAQFPETARLANIQCENCHGPQDSLAHGFAPPLGEPRVDLSANVCATCHGEPLRHARFQQWQLSAHANYALAIDEGESGSCSRCHTANGFLKWLPVLLDDDPLTDPLANITVDWAVDDTHPQTCATCHDPHAEGTTTGVGTDATVRISGDTPPLIAGFQVTDVGRGAICMTCHNSRRGLHNDDLFDDFYGTGEAVRAPHGSAQTDVLVGQNAYLVSIPMPGGHASIEDSCVACHMTVTEPPSLLSYNQGGTNHTFFASREICSECHSPQLDPDDVQNGVQFLLDQVQDLLEGAWLDLMEAQIADGNTIDVNGDGVADITDVIEPAQIEFGEYRGRQAITVTFVGGAQSGPHRLTDVDILDPSMPATCTVSATVCVKNSDCPQGESCNTIEIHERADPALLKAGWNWALFTNDGSRGVHNPFFASDALSTARDALAAAPSAVAPNRSVAPLPRGEKPPLWNNRDEWRDARRDRRR